MNLFNKLDPFIFIISFAIGIFFCYITYPTPKIIVKHPTPQNAGNIIYHDDSDNCFKYIAQEVKCPDDANTIMEHPLTIN